LRGIFAPVAPLLDYVGTRLHGGIRCLKAGARCLIRKIDNRARTIAQAPPIPALPSSDHRSHQVCIVSG
jgi:hypothetical protein